MAGASYRTLPWKKRAAMTDGGMLIVPKTARDGVTVAVSEMKWGMSFG